MTAFPVARTLLAGAVLLAFAPHPRAAEGSDPGSCETVRTYNATYNQIWVTIQDLGKTRNMDYGWVAPCSVRTWRSGGYYCGSYYYVRAEVKNFNLSRNVADTRVQINPQGENYSSWGVTLRRVGTSDSYFWEHGNTAGCTPTGVTACCASFQWVQDDPNAPPPGPPPQAFVQFNNTTRAYVAVTVYTYDNPDLHEACVAPYTKVAWPLKGYFEYRLRATAHPRSCDDPEKGRTQVTETKVKPIGPELMAAFEFTYDKAKRLYELTAP